MPVERAIICPPRCRMGSITPEERATVMKRSPVGGKYDTPVNRESAYEILSRRVEPEEEAAAARPEKAPAKQPKQQKQPEGGGGALGELLWGTGRRQGLVQTAAKQAARSVGTQVSREIVRGLLGGLLGGSGRRR